MITEEQREKRRGYIGSSDIAAIIGEDPWRNAGDVFLEKTGKLTGDKSSIAADLGTDMEGAILNMFEREKKLKTERDVWLSREGSFPACANLDGAIYGTEIVKLDPPYVDPQKVIRAVVEAKMTSLHGEWDMNTGMLPTRVLCQTHWQMWLAECDQAYAPALFSKFGHFEFKVFPVEHSKELIEELIYCADRFWNDHVLRDIPPPDVTPHLETLKRVRREPASVISLDEDAAIQFDLLTQYKAQRKQIEGLIEAAQSEILLKLGKAEGGAFSDGTMVTYLEQNGGRQCDIDALEVELRAMGRVDLFERLVYQPRFRVMRVKKAKSK